MGCFKTLHQNTREEGQELTELDSDLLTSTVILYFLGHIQVEMWIILPTTNDHFQSLFDYLKSVTYDLFLVKKKNQVYQ